MSDASKASVSSYPVWVKILTQPSVLLMEEVMELVSPFFGGVGNPFAMGST